MNLGYLLVLFLGGCTYDCSQAHQTLVDDWKIATHGVAQELRENQRITREVTTAVGACEVKGCPELEARNIKVELANLNARQNHLQDLHSGLNRVGRNLVSGNLAEVESGMSVLAGFLAQELAASGKPLDGLEDQATRYLEECR